MLNETEKFERMIEAEEREEELQGMFSEGRIALTLERYTELIRYKHRLELLEEQQEQERRDSLPF
jgi:hypothetical protein